MPCYKGQPNVYEFLRLALRLTRTKELIKYSIENLINSQ
jgi:hypothetical protein